MKAIVKAGIALHVNITLMDRDIKQIESLNQTLSELGAPLTLCYQIVGRAAKMEKSQLNRHQHRKFIQFLARAQRDSGAIIGPPLSVLSIGPISWKVGAERVAWKESSPSTYFTDAPRGGDSNISGPTAMFCPVPLSISFVEIFGRSLSIQYGGAAKFCRIYGTKKNYSRADAGIASTRRSVGAVERGPLPQPGTTLRRTHFVS